MDLNLIRSIVTLLAFVAFLLIGLWTWRRSNVARFEEAAALPFADEPESGLSSLNDARPSAGPRP